MKVAVISNQYREFCIRFAEKFHGMSLIHLEDMSQLIGFRRELGAMAAYDMNGPSPLEEQIWIVEDPSDHTHPPPIWYKVRGDGWFINAVTDRPGALNTMEHVAYTSKHLDPIRFEATREMLLHVSYGCPHHLSMAMNVMHGMALLKACGISNWDDYIRKMEEGIEKYVEKTMGRVGQESEQIVNDFMNQLKKGF
jgi:hypothetical protein